jgi:polysaccharide export outer membrane protein
MLALLAACTPEPKRPVPALPLAVESTAIGPGDVFFVEVVGEKELPKEYQVASDGTIDFPYLHTVPVAGLEPQAVARLLREQLVKEKILLDPSVSVQMKEYRSKRITVLGQTQRPGSFVFEPGVTLAQAISLAGGLNAVADHKHIRLTRSAKDGRSQTVVVDFSAISTGEAEDIPLQQGDRVFVDERLF